jgi:NAD/NADP transhydrogenase beta subunit
VQSAPPAGYQVSGEGFYQGQDPGQPAIGDVRVTFSAVPAQTVSVAAAQSSGVLTAFRDANGYTIALAEPGVVSAAALFHDEKKSEGTLTWILRGVGFVVMLIGFICMTRPLTMLFAIVPFLESLVGAGAFLVALTLAIPVTLLTIAVAWIVHRPLVGGLLLVGAIAAWYLLRQLLPRRAAPAHA